MKIGVLGTGMVGAAIGSKLVEVGNDVVMGSRTAGNEKAVSWAESTGSAASHGTFRDAAAFGEVVVNCTAGTGSLAALAQAGEENLAGKILIDIANPLDFSEGMPPTLTVANTDSLGEQIQDAFPDAKVVKTLNTLNAHLMVDPGLIPGSQNIFLSGNDADAKARVRSWLTDWFGWPADDIIDLGDISTARGPEMYLALWVRLMNALGTASFNIRIVKAAGE